MDTISQKLQHIKNSVHNFIQNILNNISNISISCLNSSEIIDFENNENKSNNDMKNIDQIVELSQSIDKIKSVPTNETESTESTESMQSCTSDENNKQEITNEEIKESIVIDITISYFQQTCILRDIKIPIDFNETNIKVIDLEITNLINHCNKNHLQTSNSESNNNFIVLYFNKLLEYDKPLRNIVKFNRLLQTNNFNYFISEASIYIEEIEILCLYDQLKLAIEKMIQEKHNHNKFKMLIMVEKQFPNQN